MLSNSQSFIHLASLLIMKTLQCVRTSCLFVLSCLSLFGFGLGYDGHLSFILSPTWEPLRGNFLIPGPLFHGFSNMLNSHWY